MTDSQWSEVWRLFAQVRDLAPAARHALLAGVEAAVREEVEAMLEADEPEPEPPAPGRQYGRYTLAALLGSGGMGEVFSARDGELGRMVAVKFVGAKARLLPAAMERLVREAQAASALNHPNLVTVHEVLRFDAGVALVTELVNGQALRAFCSAPRPIVQVAIWGAQIARALAAAHAQGIVHSDIKPENIMLRADGYIKILDFGLAQHQGLIGGLDSLPLGTLGYMSPEQTRGETLTGASDVFSLGVTLLELATGKHPFLESVASATTMAINQRQVDYAAPALPGGKQFARLLHAMLDKDPLRRPDVAEVAGRLEQISALGSRRLGWWNWRVGAGVAAAIAGIAIYQYSRPQGPPLRFTEPVAITKFSGIEHQPSYSPDGKRLAFIWSGPDGAQDDVYVSVIGAGDEAPQRITNDPQRDYSPEWSPDGRWLAWQRRAPDGSPTKIMVAPVNGGAFGEPRIVASVLDHEGFFGIAWWPDSASLVTRDQGPESYPLVRIALGTGMKTILTHQAGVNDFRPGLSPDHRRLLFLRTRRSRTEVCRLETAAPSADARCREIPDPARAVAWAPDSHSILYGVAQALWMLDLDSVRSQPLRLKEGSFSGLVSDATGRRYAFSRVISDSNIWRLDVDTQRSTQLIASSAEDSEPNFSPTGEQILFRSNRTGSYELYVCGRDGSRVRQITNTRGHLGSARWSPDGKWIAFDADRQAPGPEGKTQFDNVYVIPAAGGTMRRLTDDSTDSIVPGWSADGRWIYYTRGQKREVWKMPVDGGAAVKVNDEEMWDLEESPDGKWIWYERPYSAKGVWRRAVSGGPAELLAGTEDLTYRTWEVRGGWLFFLRGGERPGFVRMRIGDAATGRETIVGPAPRRLLRGPRTMAVSPDGKTILYTSEDLAVGDILQMEVER